MRKGFFLILWKVSSDMRKGGKISSDMRKGFLWYEERFPLIWGKFFSDMRKVSSDSRKGFLRYEKRIPLIRGKVSFDMRKGFLWYEEGLHYMRKFGNLYRHIWGKCSLFNHDFALDSFQFFLQCIVCALLLLRLYWIHSLWGKKKQEVGLLSWQI
jgi:hypothetical protein